MTLTTAYEDPSDPVNPETDHFSVETREGAPVISSDNMADVVTAVLTQGDLDEGSSLLLVSSLFGEGGVPEGDRSVLSDKAREIGATEGVWFDISLYKVQGDNPVKLDVVPIPVNIAAKAPEALQKDGRTFYFLYAHDGKATNAAEGAGDTIAWKTSEFLTYLLAYKDAESSGSDSAAGDATDNAATKGSSASPKTGDSFQPIIVELVMAAIASGIVAIAVALRRRRED